MEKVKMSTEPFHVTDSNFEETLKNNKLFFVDFWANWCGPCRALAPTIVELSKEYSGKVLIGKLDVDENPVTAAKFQVFSIPTMIVFKYGKEAERLVGLCPKNKIGDTLQKHLM
jgi:thioredoxin 1